MSNCNEKKADIINSIKSPIGLLALIVLVSEVILGLLSAKADGLDFTLLITSMFLLLYGILFIIYKKEKTLTSVNIGKEESIVIKNDLFLASPMASFESEESYISERKNMLSLIDTFRKECNFKSIVYAGNNIESMADFDAPDLSVKDDFEAIKESEYFAMVLPQKIYSSVLVEAGAALALSKPSIYFVKSKNDLPFLLAHSEMAFTSVKIYEYSTIEDIKKLIARHKKSLLPH